MKFHLPEQNFTVEEGSFIRLKIEVMPEEVEMAPEVVAPEVPAEPAQPEVAPAVEAAPEEVPAQ